MSRLVHLHVHSHYSLLEALPKIPELVAAAKALGSPALALTDTGNLYGAIEFYKECRAEGIKPIIGVEAFLAPRTCRDKEARIDAPNERVILLVENLDGYKNLLRIVTASYLEGFYYRPRIDLDLLRQNRGGLIAILLSPPNDAEKWRELFDENHLFLDVSRRPEASAEAKKLKILPVYAPDVKYLKPEDRPAYETLLSIQSHLGTSLRRGGFGAEEEDFSLENAANRGDVDEEAMKNTLRIAESCNLELELGRWVFPNLALPAGKTAESEFRRMVEEGYKLRGVERTEAVENRVKYELDIIEKKNFFPYFLVVGDLLRYARENRILTNIRGSVAGSMVTYLAGITNVNPLEYGLPFERFLNPDRPLPPDIDMDFADNRRDEMIDYARQKYGAERVAQIGTFGTMMARGAVRDVTRAMGLPVSLGDRIAKLIPMGAQGFPMTIDRAKKENPDFKKLYDEEEEVRRVVDMAEKIEGGARHISVHAAGVVISPTTLTDYTALQLDTKGGNKVITQYDMYSIEEAGLLKYDFLGLRNLSIIADTVERIKKIEGKDLDIDKIPLDDKKTFEMLARGETEGTFQLNGDAMTKFLVDLKPSVIHDVNAMVALYRPGPMQFIPLFIERKHSPSLVTYLDPALKPILEKTYGVLVYQDDLLMIAKDIAGYSWGEVDKFRKAVGKKIPEEMRAQKEKFIDGVVEHSKWPKKKAEELWSWIEPFAAYGFNKAHSVSYGRVAYQTAYLKANFPEIYMSAVLSAESGDVETIGTMVAECKRMGIEVLPPSVNDSYSQFTVPPKNSPKEKYQIRFGLTTIKNFGQSVATSIIEERKRGGKYKSLIDFLDRIKDKNLNKKSLESLIMAGAFDELPETEGGELCERGRLLGNIDTLLSYHKESQKAHGGLSLFDAGSLPPLRLEPTEPASRKDKLKWEKELLGLYLSGHPLEEYEEKLKGKDMNVKRLGNFREGTECVIAGLVAEVREATTRANERMAFIRLEDLTGETDVVLFPKVFGEYREFITPENCIAIKGKVSKRNGETSFIAEKVKAL